MKMSVPKRFYYGIGNLMNHKYIHRLMPAKYYIKVRWYQTMGYELDLKNPKTFNEKLQWLKLYDRNPLYPLLVDKYEVKKWISEKIGAEYVIPTLSVYNSADEIDIDSLPNEFVLKCTHDSGSTIICKDKSAFDIESAKKKLSDRLRYNYYWNAREWPYYDVKPRIIAEPLLHNVEDEILLDYKYFCFHGKSYFMYISNDASHDARTTFFNMSFERLNMRMKAPNSDITPPKPVHFIEMERLANILSTNIPHVRVDFYSTGSQIYVGEMTLYHCGGFQPIYPTEWEHKLGQLIHIGTNEN